MEPQATGVTDGRGPGLLSPCVCSTLRMVSRAVTQLYDDILRPSGLRVIDQTTPTRSLRLLERDRMIERVPHPDGRIKAMRLTRKGRRVLNVARPLWAQAQDKVLRDLGTRVWDDAQRRLARLLHVAVEKRRLRRNRMRKPVRAEATSGPAQSIKRRKPL